MPLFSKHGLSNSVKHHMKKQPPPPISCPTRRGTSLPTRPMKGHSVKEGLVSPIFLQDSIRACYD